MTHGFAASLVNNWLDTDFATASLYAKLHTADPGSAGTTAAAAGDTTRKQCTMAAAAGGSKASSAAIGPWTNSSTTEDIASLSLWTASSAGTFKASVDITGAAQTWLNTNTYTITSLTIAITPIAA